MRLRAGVALLAAGMACGRAPVVPRAVAPLRVAHEAAPLSLDPLVASDSPTASILANIYDPLVDYDRDMKLVPRLAAGWSTPDDHTWIFDLRRGVVFHDGRPFTAEDVLATLERARRDPGSAHKGALESVATVNADGPHRVRIVTRQPAALLLHRLAAILIVPAGRADLAQHPVGTGAYRWQARTDDTLDLVAFDRHWRGRPTIPEARLVTARGALVAEELRAGRLDVTRKLSNSVAAEPGRFRVRERAGLSSVYLWMDSRRGRSPFEDRRVRQALSLAIDRRALIAVLGARGVPLHQLAPPGVVGHIADLAPAAPDPERARALLREAGHPQGLDLVLVDAGGPPPDNVGEALRPLLAPAGFRITVQPATWPMMVAGWEAAQIPFFVAGWRFTSGEVTGFLRDCIATRRVDEGYSSYNPGFADQGIDEAIAQNALAMDSRKGVEGQERLMRRVLDALPLVPLFTRDDRYGLAERVRFEPRLDGRLLLDEMSLVEPSSSSSSSKAP